MDLSSRVSGTRPHLLFRWILIIVFLALIAIDSLQRSKILQAEASLESIRAQWRQASSAADRIVRLDSGAQGIQPRHSLSAQPSAADTTAQWILDDLKVRGPLLDRYRAMAHLKYFPFYLQTNMTAAQIEQFEAAVAERDVAMLKLGANAQARGISSDDPNLAAAIQVIERDFVGGIRSITDPDRLASYDKISGLQGPLKAVSSYLASANQPLTVSQLDLLAQSINLNTVNGVIDWHSVLQQSGATLSPAQTKAFAAVQEQSEANDQFEKAYTAATHRKTPPPP